MVDVYKRQLRDESDLPAQLLERVVARIHAREPHRALRRVVEAGDEVHNRALARALSLIHISIIPVVGHRGAAALWPENTMYAFREAEKLGVDGLETDIRMTRDGELVLCHDERVDRTTDGTGRVCDLSLRELRALDAGRPFCGGPTGLRIPTLGADVYKRQV